MLEWKIKDLPRVYWLNEGVYFSIHETGHHIVFLSMKTEGLHVFSEYPRFLTRHFCNHYKVYRA